MQIILILIELFLLWVFGSFIWEAMMSGNPGGILMAITFFGSIAIAFIYDIITDGTEEDIKRKVDKILKEERKHNSRRYR
ncbi:MAG: hypothetical protein J6N92_04665 [Alloprevotella sp.]|nr:hypothetical protein [Alloprevotella sp.]